MGNKSFSIPPVFVSAEPTSAPDRPAFRKRPAGCLHIGDLIWLEGQAWRIKDRRQYNSSIMIGFTFYPCAGGRPLFDSFAPREWIPAITFHVTEDTQPMPPIAG